MSSPSSAPRFTEKQGQYLAFIYMYTLVNCCRAGLMMGIEAS